MRTGRGELLQKTFSSDTLSKSRVSSSKSTHDMPSSPSSANNVTPAATELVLIQVASFLRRELPIRLAHQVLDLERVHPALATLSHVRGVRDLYAQSCLDILQFDTSITTSDQEAKFAALIEKIYDRHSAVLVQMARGAYEFRRHLREHEKQQNAAGSGGENEVFELQAETHEFLDRFYLCRIGIRVLIGQYLALRQPAVPNYIGIICSQTSPYEIVKRAIDDAAFMCTRIYGDAPDVVMSGRLDLTFPYVPTHLRKLPL
jgi:pyruvate dehydrogenase kinase 2/3/4